METKLFHLLQQIGTVEFWENLFHSFRILGPLAPILLAMVESLIPMLPLVAIVTLNVAAHGMVLGFLYSWIGSALGSTLVFLFFRRLVKPYALRFADRHPKVAKAQEWVNGRLKWQALFFIIIMPFTPSSFVNFAVGVSDFDEKLYIKVMITAKIIMLVLLSLFGQSVVQAIKNPAFLIVAGLLAFVLHLISKYINRKNNLE
ncbi:MAG: TVP38/TMEM64 family protein [Lachnospiraceae bacterium]|nr:TVP38/TMEM64 family protein [Lachnospiraceae bacterium]